jgi:hypothetical protein
MRRKIAEAVASAHVAGVVRRKPLRLKVFSAQQGPAKRLVAFKAGGA